jgi:uncharacterized LabA/DUF88 family protein
MGMGHEYYLRRWMMFVDGENLTLRAQEFCQQNGIALNEGKFYAKDAFVWLTSLWPTDNPSWRNMDYELQPRGIRAHFYTSLRGDHDRVRSVEESLKAIGFTPHVFKRPSDSRQSKGVDISLAKDLLANAFMNNYEAAILVAGDGDFVPLVDEVKRLGKIVYVMFFSANGLSPDLKLAADIFIPLDQPFQQPRGGA